MYPIQYAKLWYAVRNDAMRCDTMPYTDDNTPAHTPVRQEKALVEGRRAGAAACKHLGIREGFYPSILPVEEDEPHVALGREAFRALRSAPPIRAGIEVFLP